MPWKKVDPIAAPLLHRIESAVEAAGNDTLAASVISAKQNHPGWKNVTGTAEGSIAMQPMEKISPTRYRGLFGSFDVFYFKFLELGTRFIHADFTLRRAADAEFPRVGKRVQSHMR